MKPLTRSQLMVLKDLDNRPRGLGIVRGISRRTGLRPGTVGRALAALGRRRMVRKATTKGFVFQITERGEEILNT